MAFQGTHVYVVVERGSRKIRRKVVKDKSATVLSVFDKHILPGTTFMCDPGKENEHFKSLAAISTVYEIPGPIHVDLSHRYRNTQTVEGSHATVKMRLRLGRGIRRHNLQSVLDFEDFVYTRTNGTPQDIFRVLGSASLLYHSITHDNVQRSSLISRMLREDSFEPIEDLSVTLIKRLCTDSVFRKANIFTVQASKLISTYVERSKNSIEGEFRSGMIYEQSIRWGRSDVQVPFSLSTIIVFCSCKYFNKEIVQHGFCCKHHWSITPSTPYVVIIRQLFLLHCT